MSIWKVSAGVLVGTFALDMLWLGVIAKSWYRNSLGGLLRSNGANLTPNWPAAFLVYLAIVMGVVMFVLPKAGNSLSVGFCWGALFGAVTYGIYDFTNFSILAGWPLSITLLDFAWGMFLCGSVSTLGVWLQR